MEIETRTSASSDHPVFWDIGCTKKYSYHEIFIELFFLCLYSEPRMLTFWTKIILYCFLYSCQPCWINLAVSKRSGMLSWLAHCQIVNKIPIEGADSILSQTCATSFLTGENLACRIFIIREWHTRRKEPRSTFSSQTEFARLANRWLRGGGINPLSMFDGNNGLEVIVR